MCAQILLPTAENIELAARALLRDGLVAIPTETVYGLAGLAFHEVALTKIFAAKERPTFDPLICHVAAPAKQHPDWLAVLEKAGLVDADALEPIAREQVEKLLSAFWPGPLTLVLPKTLHVPDLATSGLATVAVRSPAHPVAQALLTAVGQPLAAPSANRFGRISPTQTSHVQAELGERIDWILEGGPCEIGLESTVLFVQPTGGVVLLRPGAITPAMVHDATGIEVALTENPTVAPQHAAMAPGLLASHYAPRKPLTLLPFALANMPTAVREQLFAELPTAVRVGVLLAQGNEQNCRQSWAPSSVPPLVCSLSESGDIVEAARHLFAGLRMLDDNPNVDVLWAEPPADLTGLGYAIHDRLRRASHR